MNDKELLEKAARSAGIEIIYVDGVMCGADKHFTTTPCEEWNPLQDDADAFRLLLDIGADVYHGTNEYDEPIVTIQPDYLSLNDAPSALADSPAEIRRAIVRAAAAIGEEL